VSVNMILHHQIQYLLHCFECVICKTATIKRNTKNNTLSNISQIKQKNRSKSQFGYNYQHCKKQTQTDKTNHNQTNKTKQIHNETYRQSDMIL
jgi:hypothetical protein